MNTQKKQERWLRLVQLVEKVNYGRIELIIKDGLPVRAEITIKQIKLDVQDEFEEKLSTITL